MKARTADGAVIYIDRSEVHAGAWEELRRGIGDLVAFVDHHQPQMTTYAFYLDEDVGEMTVVSVHPNSASLERHLEMGAPEFKKLAPCLTLRGIEVFGSISARAVELLEQKASSLGTGAVSVHEQFVGFHRAHASDDR